MGAVTKLPRHNHWVDVGVKSPEPLIDVLIVCDYDGEPTVEMAFSQANGEWFLTGSEPLIRVRPNHWMHLPEPPPGLPKTEGLR